MLEGIETSIYVPILGPKKLGEYETLKAKLKKGPGGPMGFYCIILEGCRI